jgi:hypothetical protein
MQMQTSDLCWFHTVAIRQGGLVGPWGATPDKDTHERPRTVRLFVDFFSTTNTSTYFLQFLSRTKIIFL